MAGLGFTETPRYVRLNDVVLIGVTHAPIILAMDEITAEETERKIEELEREVGGLQHLLVEASKENWEKVNKRNLQITGPTFETIAAEAFSGTYHFANGDVDYVAAADERGISPYTFGILQMFTHLREARVGAYAFYMMADNMTAILQHGRATITGYQNLEVERVTKNLRDILNPIWTTPLLQSCVEAGTAFRREYLRGLRDHTQYVPRIREMQELQGKKGAMLGDDHIDTIAGILTGERPKEYESWQQYKQRRPELQEAFSYIEGITQ